MWHKDWKQVKVNVLTQLRLLAEWLVVGQDSGCASVCQLCSTVLM